MAVPEQSPIITMTPIGVLRCAQRYCYDASRQGASAPAASGCIELAPHCNYEQALADLEGFSHLWVVSFLHHNLAKGWKPRVRPPRSPQQSRGLFATRAPYRPNPIGLSCVELLQINGRMLSIRGHDLLDGTPVLDLKPYLPYADSFPQAAIGWLGQVDQQGWRLVRSAAVEQQLAWLVAHGVPCLPDFLDEQLCWEPFASRRKRVRQLSADNWEVAYRTWRVRFGVCQPNVLHLDQVRSGYTAAELHDGTDPYADKPVHRAFRQQFGDPGASDDG